MDKKSIGENYENLKGTIGAINQDYEKFNNKKIRASGLRVRALLLNTKKLCDVLRKQINEDIKAIPIKHRNKSSDDENKEMDCEDEHMDIEKPEIVKKRRKANKIKEEKI